jgi:hypothetical protein
MGGQFVGTGLSATLEGPSGGSPDLTTLERNITVTRKWKPLTAAVAAIGVLAVGAPAAGATVGLPAQAGLGQYSALGPYSGLGGSSGLWPSGGSAAGVAPVGTGPCASISTERQGPTGENPVQICVGSGLVFVAPAVGQIASVVGPTIIGPAVIGTLVNSAGSAGVG